MKKSILCYLFFVYGLIYLVFWVEVGGFLSTPSDFGYGGFLSTPSGYVCHPCKRGIFLRLLARNIGVTQGDGVVCCYTGDTGGRGSVSLYRRHRGTGQSAGAEIKYRGC